MTTRKYTLPLRAGTVLEGQRAQFTLPWVTYFAGLEDVSGRVCEPLDGSTATPAQIVDALKAAGLMKEGP